MDKKKILIVEDELQLRHALTNKLINGGYTVLEAEDGKEGLKLALDDHPDLVLLDIIMPVMDGVTMLKNLRDDNWGSKVPVIILTNLGDASTVDLEPHNISDYLVKTDWKLEDVVKKIRKILEG